VGEQPEAKSPELPRDACRAAPGAWWPALISGGVGLFMAVVIYRTGHVHALLGDPAAREKVGVAANDPVGLAVLVLLPLLPLGVALYTLLQALNQKLGVTSTGLVVQNWRRRRTFIPLDAIVGLVARRTWYANCVWEVQRLTPQGRPRRTRVAVCYMGSGPELEATMHSVAKACTPSQEGLTQGIRPPAMTFGGNGKRRPARATPSIPAAAPMPWAEAELPEGELKRRVQAGEETETAVMFGRVFHTGRQMWVSVLTAVVAAAIFAFLAYEAGLLLPSGREILRHRTQLPVEIWAGALVAYSVIPLACLAAAVHMVLICANLAVVLTDLGVCVRDWRRRITFYPWDWITGLARIGSSSSVHWWGLEVSEPRGEGRGPRRLVRFGHCFGQDPPSVRAVIDEVARRRGMEQCVPDPGASRSAGQ
jgi:hypothetical protein